MSEPETSQSDVSHLQAFRMLVLRVIELYVHKNISDDVNIDKMAELINTNPLAGLVRRMIQDRAPEVDCVSPVTRREVILAVTRFLKSAEIKIHSTGSPDFNVLLTRAEFNDVIAAVYEEYQKDVLREIREDEEEFKRKLAEIALIEKGELDNVIIAEFNEKKSVEAGASAVKPQEKLSIPLLPSTQSQSNALAADTKQPPSSAPVPNSTITDTQETVDAPTSADADVAPTQQSVVGTRPQSEAQPQSQPKHSVDTAEDAVMEDASEKKVEYESQSEMTDKEATVDAAPVLEPSKAEVIEETQQDDEVDEAKAEAPVEEVGEDKEKPEAAKTKDIDDEDDRTESEHSDSKQDDEAEAIKEDKEKKEDEEKEKASEEEEDDDEEEEESEEDSKKRANEDDEDDSMSLPAKKKAKTNSSSSVPSSAGGAVPNKKLQVIANALIAQISSYKYASTFLQPVQTSNAPDYYSLIKEPHDLKSMKAMVKDGRIQTRDELERAILLMFANAIMYNKSDSDISTWTREMQLAVDDMIKMFKEVDDKN